MTSGLTWAVVAVWGCLVGGAYGVTLGISSDGMFFTMDNQPTFLVGASYFGICSTPDDLWEKDLADFKAAGYNWLRLWAHWPGWPMTTPDGVPIQPCFDTFVKRVVEMDSQGMIADVTFARGDPPYPGNITQHIACVQTIAKVLLNQRNVYFDLANECTVRDKRYVSYPELAQLVKVTHDIDPKRIMTASGGTYETVSEGHVDFIANHLPRAPGCAARTFELVRNFTAGMPAKLGRVVPFHLQEPFRRDYQPNWNPAAPDFMQDVSGGRAGGAAGWCFHNGGNCCNKDGRPFRCFNMTAPEGRLIDQFDDVESAVLKPAVEVCSPIAPATSIPFHPTYKEQLVNEVGYAEGYWWVAEEGKTDPGHVASSAIPSPAVQGVKTPVTWVISRNDTSHSAGSPLVTLYVVGGGQTAGNAVTVGDVPVGGWHKLTLESPVASVPVTFRMFWHGTATVQVEMVLVG